MSKTTASDEDIRVGDVITIETFRADGTIGPGGPLQSWRVKSVSDEKIVLTPIEADGTVSPRDAWGEYAIVKKQTKDG